MGLDRMTSDSRVKVGDTIEIPKQTLEGDRSKELLPPELQHDNIRIVRDMGNTMWQAYQIVFDQHFLPFDYWNPRPEGWEISYARTEFHRYRGILGFLYPKKECITIVVKERDEQ